MKWFIGVVVKTVATCAIMSTANGLLFYHVAAPKLGIEATWEQCFTVALLLWLLTETIERAIVRAVKAANEDEES